MLDKKVKISSILDSQIPEFIQAESPLFKEFLQQYYISEEHEYGTSDLAGRIGDLKDIGSFSRLTYAAVPVTVTQEVLDLDDVINVSSTAGFPNTYGLIKINNEIITYTGKTNTSFTGCIRGFSGIDRIEGELQPEFLNFNSTSTDSHDVDSVVQNLSLVFLQEFYRKYKSQFLPGFEERQFTGVNVDNILSRARDFYSSKGTDSSLKILFSVLFGKTIDVIKPFDNTILASSADWSITDNIIVEQIDGDPSKLAATTVLENSLTNSTAKATVSRVTQVSLGNKIYYKLFLSNGSITNPLSVSKRTKVLGTNSSNTTLTVDSTIGFPESGSFYNLTNLGSYAEVTYSGKSSNQFFNCVGLSTTLVENSPIIDGVYLYGFEDNDLSKPVRMRIVGSILGSAKNSDTTKLFSSGDRVGVKHLGEKTDQDDKKFNTWFYNNITFTNVTSVVPASNALTTEVDHYLHVGDKVDILLKETRGPVVLDAQVTSVNNSLEFQIGSGTLQNGVPYIVKKKLNFASTNLLSGNVLSNIQNSFVDKNKNTYVAFSGYPSYESIDTTNRTKAASVGIATGTYYVHVVDNNNIRLALSPSAIESKVYATNAININAHGFLNGEKVYSDQTNITPSSLYGSSLINQNNFKRINKTPKPAKIHKDIIGAVGVALNGVEFDSPISSDAIFYGQVEQVNILDAGSEFDVINAPQVSVAGTVGSGAVVHGNFEGKIEGIVLTNPGFNYIETPSVTISGGNGSSSVCEARMRGFTHSSSFTDFNVNLLTDRVTTTSEHRFLDGEEVTYVATGTPVGIGSTAVGFSTDRLSSGATYFVAKHDNTSYSLAISRADALAKTNLIDFNAFGNQDHTLRSRQIRKVIDKIVVNQSSNDFSNKKVVVDGIAWPPSDQKDIFSSFVGVNVENNYIYARNHKFKNGDNVVYSVDGTSITGLTASSYYKVTVLDNHRFKLSEAGTASSITSVNYDNRVYADLSSVGVGTHTFKYPDIVVAINGLVSVGETTSIPSYYNATGTPVVRGSLESVFIRSGGVGYGSSDIVNYNKTPQVKVLTGKDADIRPLVSAGKIQSVYIADGGSEYTTPPTVRVVGKGRLAELTATTVDGVITAITIIDGGSGYDDDTVVEVIPTGKDVKLNSEVHEWKINNIERYSNILSNVLYKDLVQTKSISSSRQNKLVSFYPGKFYRNLLSDNIVTQGGGALAEKTTGLSHSPIIGWAYDGNPIYGPYGNGKAIPDNTETGGVKKIYSSYEVDVVTTPDLRPPGFANGYFAQDYVYKASGDLDEYNGRYLVNSDFPNGTYAYFSTLDVNGDLAYPYITKSHYNDSDEFNYSLSVNQLDEHLNSGEYKRVVTQLGLDDPSRDYPFLSEILQSNSIIEVSSVKSSKINSITIENSGKNYKVGEQINLSDTSIDAEIQEVLGKNIKSITTTDNVVENITLSVKDNKITGISTLPHGFVDSDIVEISGISSSLYKNIEGFRTVGVSTVSSTLSAGIAATTVTGLSTSIQISEPTITRKFSKGDVITIGNEQMLITNVDTVNNKYKVTRSHNNTAATTHNNGVAVSKTPTLFTFEFETKLENKNIDFGHKQTFDAPNSVGIGTTYSSVVVGVAGSTDITVSVPPRAIYLPNHRFNTGDKVEYVSAGGSVFASPNFDLSSTFLLDDVASSLYTVKFAKDFIGISTTKAGISTSAYIYFTNVNGNNHSFEVQKENLTAVAKKVSAQVVLDTQHTLKQKDEVRLNVTPSRTQEYAFKFNNVAKKLVVNPVSFASTAIAVGSTSEITIEGHDFETGDIVIYTNSVGIATPLQNNREYYVIKISDDKIKLADNKLDVSKFPYENIIISNQGHGTHEISKINPRLEFYRGGKVSIAASDASLIDYDINFYTDNKFESRYESSSIKKIGTFGDSNTSTVISIDVSNNLPKELFYRIEGDGIKYTNTYPTSADTDVNLYSNISIVESRYNKKHRITSVGSTTFDFTLVGSAETTSYTSAGFSSAFYSTSSAFEKGGIHSIKVVNSGKDLKELPVVTSIASTTGSAAILKVNTTEIGQISDDKVIQQGIEFLEDKTLAPKADSNVVLKLKNVSTLKSIGINTGGRNYTSAPIVVAIGNTNIQTRTTLQSSSVFNVEIISNDSNLSEDLRIVPTVNSNGVRVTNAVSSLGTNTLSLRAPNAGFTTANPFPFAINDKIFVENIKITNTADGYNSSDYDYSYFTVTGINTVSGTESVSYSIAGIGSTGGSFDATNSFGRVIKADELAVFTPEFEKIQFSENEKIVLNSGEVLGSVASNGWDPQTETLKVKNVSKSFKKGDIIRGQVGNFKATVEDVFEFDFDINVGSTVEDASEWRDDVGKLNSSLQNIHDSDYYQRFSYSIRGEVAYEHWKESVNSLDHTSGYKNFSDLQVLNGAGTRVGMSITDTQLDLDVVIPSSASVHTRMFYDLASEDTNVSNLSKFIIFDSKVITDYNESITNKVLLIDDISSQFTGYTTSIGGGIVGMSTFSVFTGGDTLFYHTFDPAAIDTSTNTITIPQHNFNTGERLVYSPTNNSQNTGTTIGINTTSSPGIGIAATDKLPSEVFAIKITDDQFKLAIGSSEATAGTSVDFDSITGIGSTHSLAVPSDVATSRAIITVDNIIQSPVSRKDVSIGLSQAVGIGSTTVTVNDISNIKGKSLIKIEDEILKVQLVGVGLTNRLAVIRGQMGTVAAAHTVGAATTVLSGDYRIDHGKLYFTDVPYGPTGIGSLTTKSTFAGRAYYRLDYTNNVILDDISEQFDGSTDTFDLKLNGQTVTGINSSFGAILIDNIFQKPFFGDVGSIQKSDYQITGVGQTIDFTGTGPNGDLPKGGIINEFSVGIGSGYQIPRQAVGFATVSSGAIQSVGVSTGGSGYISAPRVSIADTLGVGVGASVIATVANGVITGFTVAAGGSGYSASNPPLVTVEAPAPYRNLSLVGGNGSGAKMDVVVGTGGSIVNFNMSDRGSGYEVGDVLSLTGIPFNTVGIGTSNFVVTVVNKYQDKFAGWTFGQLLELDDFSNQFNGFRKSFLLTRTTVNKEYYSIVAKQGSGIILANNLLIFLNDVLQKPNVDYVFTSGTRLEFKEAPKPGSNFRIYFYTGSSADFREIDVDESIKPGDRLRLQQQNRIPSQNQRIIYELIASDTVETETYGGVGIVTDSTFKRPVEWTKQTSDLIIDGIVISKERDYLEPQYFPASNLIAPFDETSTKMYINDSWAFQNVDNLGQTLNDIRVVGVGTTVVVEEFKNVTYSGDYGVITSIGASTSGINTTTPMIEFDLRPSDVIYDSAAPAGKVSKPGIAVGDYFVIRNTTLGAGVTSIIGDVNSVVAIGNSFIDNVYYASKVTSIGSSTIRVSANVNSLTGINTANQPNSATFGTYSWGAINTGTRSVSTAKSFTFYNQNGIAGIETSSHVSRLLQLRVAY